jgi:hypothetical protein
MMKDTVNAADMDNSLDTLLNQRFAVLAPIEN